MLFIMEYHGKFDIINTWTLEPWDMPKKKHPGAETPPLTGLSGAGGCAQWPPRACVSGRAFRIWVDGCHVSG